MANWAEGCGLYSDAVTFKASTMKHPLIAAALFSLLGASPAFAEDIPKIVVPAGNLDLNSAAGQAELRQRVNTAASSLCLQPWMTKTPDSEFAVGYNKQIYRACVGRVTERTMDYYVGRRAG
jgi:UrcA family protein